jgi:hypothetical protein
MVEVVPCDGSFIIKNEEDYYFKITPARFLKTWQV